jgi:DNA-binding MarR family transcriptional regulator
VEFDLPRDLEVVHQPGRLRIMTMVYRERDVGFAAMRNALGMTAGNLAAHLQRLEQAAFIEQRQVFSRQGVASRIRLTAAGAAAFQRYLALLRAYLEAQG